MENRDVINSQKRPFAGMIDKGAEFFMVNGKLYVSYNRKVNEWPDFPEEIIEKVRDDMLKYPEAIKSLGQWENLLPEDYEFRYIACRFGGIDDEPDISIDGIVQQSEYVPCKLRGKCRFEGKLCQSLMVDNGVLTRREMDVLRLIDLDAKLIADKLYISTETVQSHIISLKNKTGLVKNTALAVFASKKGII